MSRLLPALPLLLAAALPVRAEPAFEERLLVEGPAPARVGGSVTLLTREELEPFALLSVAEALELAAGVRLDGGGSRAGTNAASLRGGDPNQVLVLLDGVVLNDPTGPEGGAVNLASLSVEEIESIEIVRGPASALHGGRALAGLVHLRTRRSDGELRVRAAGEVGSFNLLRGGVVVEGGDGRLEIAREREKDRLEGDRFRQSRAAGSWRRELSERSSLELAGRWARTRSLDHPEGSGGPELGDGALRRKDRDELAASLRWAAATKSGWRHQVLLAAADQEEDFDSPAIGFAVPAATGRTDYRRLDLGWTLTRSFSQRLGGLLSLGVHDERARQRGELDLGFPVPSDYELERTTITGAFTLTGGGSRTSWELGLRLDEPDEGDSEWSGQAGLVRGFREGRTQLSFSFAEGFQLPSAFALSAPPELGGNPDLRPETSRSFEIGLDARNASGSLAGSVRAWLARYEDLVDFDFELFTHLNRGSVRAEGLELAGRWTPRKRLSLGGRLAWQDIVDDDTKLELLRRPRLFGSLDLAWRPREGLSLSFDLRGRSSFDDEQVPVDGPREVDGGLWFGLGLRWQASDSLELTARVDDLFGSAPDARLGYPAAGTSLRVGLAASWP